MNFDIAVSLGESCQSRHHLIKYLKKRYGKDAGGGSFFFDWAWRDKGVSGVIEAFRQGFAVEKSSFILKRTSKDRQTYHTQYGFYYPHDFDFTEAKDDESVGAAFEEQWSEFHAKYLRRAERMKRLLASHKNILFILAGPIENEEAKQLADVFQNTYGLEKFTVLHLWYSNRNGSAINHPKFISIPIVYRDWPGDEQSWANALDKFDIRTIPDNFDEFLSD